MPMTPNTDHHVADRSKAFLAQPRSQALERYPDLQSAFAIRDELQQIARDAKPLNSTVQKQVDVAVHNNLYTKLSQGQEPRITDNTREAVRFQVAYLSAEYADGARRLDPKSTANISNEHRDFLINHAERAIRTNNPQRPDDVAELHMRARETASLVGSLDLPTNRNPFKAAELKDAYTHQQHETLTRQAQREQQRGLARGGPEL